MIPALGFNPPCPPPAQPAIPSNVPPTQIREIRLIRQIRVRQTAFQPWRSPAGPKEKAGAESAPAIQPAPNLFPLPLREG